MKLPELNSAATYAYLATTAGWSADEGVRLRFRAAERFIGKATAVLDVGCRDGTFALALARKGIRVDGIDTDGTAVMAANEQAIREGLDRAIFFQQDVLAPAIPLTHYPAVVCMELLEHLPDPEKALAVLSRLVAPGGQLIISVPANTHISDPGHKTTFYREDLDKRIDGLEWSPDCPHIWLMYRIRRKDA